MISSILFQNDLKIVNHFTCHAINPIMVYTYVIPFDSTVSYLVGFSFSLYIVLSSLVHFLFCGHLVEEVGLCCFVYWFLEFCVCLCIFASSLA